MMKVIIGDRKQIRRCKTCGKRWCGTDLKVQEIHGPDYVRNGHGVPRITFATKKCRDKAEAK